MPGSGCPESLCPPASALSSEGLPAWSSPLHAC